MPRKNPIAKNLRTRRFRLKVIKSKKVYNRSRLQNDEIKESKEDNYKIIREIQSISNIHKEETRTQKYLIIILIIIVLITLGIIGLFAKRKLSTGSFFIN